MSFGATASKRREAARKHVRDLHQCLCGRKILGNAYHRHKRACRIWLAAQPYKG
jgi:hypothetical protein